MVEPLVTQNSTPRHLFIELWHLGIAGAIVSPFHIHKDLIMPNTSKLGANLASLPFWKAQEYYMNGTFNATCSILISLP